MVLKVGAGLFRLVLSNVSYHTYKSLPRDISHIIAPPEPHEHAEGRCSQHRHSRTH